jgi:hypothetical protein
MVDIMGMRAQQARQPMTLFLARLLRGWRSLAWVCCYTHPTLAAPTQQRRVWATSHNGEGMAFVVPKNAAIERGMRLGFSGRKIRYVHTVKTRMVRAARSPKADVRRAG